MDSGYQDRIEKHHVDQFLKLLNCHCEPKRPQDKQPDFYIETDNKIIAIEHTQLFRQQTEGQLLQAKENLSWEIVQRAKHLYESENQQSPVRVSVYFNSFEKLTQKDKKELPNLLANIVLSNLPEAGNMKTVISKNILTEDLPGTIDEISIARINGLTINDWAAPNSAFVPNATFQQIYERINEKEAISAKYSHKYNERWLLIASGGGGLATYFEFSKEIERHKFKSLFDRIFILINGYSFLELQIQPTECSTSTKRKTLSLPQPSVKR